MKSWAPAEGKIARQVHGPDKNRVKEHFFISRVWILSRLRTLKPILEAKNSFSISRLKISRVFRKLYAQDDLCSMISNNVVIKELFKPDPDFLTRLRIATSMRLHHLVGGSTGPVFSLLRFHKQEQNKAR